jgi:hypothetical protein
MKRVLSFIPDEWISAGRAFRLMWIESARTPHATAKTLIGIAIPFAAGASVQLISKVSVSVDFVQGVLTVVGVLAGFVVTLMLFTGGTSGTEKLNHDQTRRYASKTYYLLFSQTVTLACYLASLVLGSAWLFTNTGATHGTAHAYVAPFLCGSVGLALARTILLPAQIFERHHFAIETTVEMKATEEHEKLEEAQKALHELRPRRA